MKEQSLSTVTESKQSRISKKQLKQERGIPIGRQQQFTAQGRVLRDERTIVDSNVKDETIIEVTLRLQGGMKNEATTTSAESVGERQVKRRTSEPCSEISEINEIKLDDVTEH